MDTLGHGCWELRLEDWDRKNSSCIVFVGPFGEVCCMFQIYSNDLMISLKLKLFGSLFGSFVFILGM